jgi:MFS family permease
MKIQKQKLIIIFTVLIDVIGVGIVIPLLPFYVQQFSASPMTVTLLFSVYSICAFFSSPVIGSLSDKIGRRPALIVSIFSTSIGWFIFAFANSLGMLFLGRIIDGLASGNYTVAQSYISDISKDGKERTKNMGLIGAIFGIGFIVGPLIGAFLHKVSPSFPFLAVGSLAMLNTFGAIFFLPETRKKIEDKEKISINPFLPLGRAFRDATLRLRYAVWFLLGMAIASMQSIFALYVQKVYNFSATSVGWSLAGIGALMAINQGFFLKKFWLKNFEEYQLERWLFIPIFFGYLLLGTPFVGLFFVGMLIIGFSQSTLNVVMHSQVSGIAGENKRGEALGVMASVFSVSMAIGPIVAGYFFALYSSLPYFAGAFFLLLAFFLISRRGENSRKIEKKQKELGFIEIS